MGNMRTDDSVGFKIRRLTDHERIFDFSSGDPDMDDFIVNRAHLYSEQRLSANYVLCHSMYEDLPVAFFSLSCDRVCMTDFASSTEFNRFRRKRFVNSKRLKGFPAIKIGRIAVMSDFQGQGLSSVIVDTIKSFVSEVRYVGCRFLTVDSYRNRVDMYRKYGFELLCSSTSDTESTTCHMYYDLISLK